MADIGRTTKASLEKTTIAVLGMGHVGLPTALGLAELGWQVIGADSNPYTVATLKAGKSWFYEPDLEPLLRKHLASGRFTPSADVDGAISAATVVFVCVGTPQGDDGKADLTQIEDIARTVARNLNGYKLIVREKHGAGDYSALGEEDNRTVCPCGTSQQWEWQEWERQEREEAPRGRNGPAFRRGLES